jgi:hypothetical protein
LILIDEALPAVHLKQSGFHWHLYVSGIDFYDESLAAFSLGINHTPSVNEQKIPQPLGEHDGKLISGLDGMGVNVTASMLYELNERTRAGIAWTSDAMWGVGAGMSYELTKEQGPLRRPGGIDLPLLATAC